MMSELLGLLFFPFFNEKNESLGSGIKLAGLGHHLPQMAKC
jgi:hypothetical protein